MVLSKAADACVCAPVFTLECGGAVDKVAFAVVDAPPIGARAKATGPKTVAAGTGVTFFIACC